MDVQEAIKRSLRPIPRTTGYWQYQYTTKKKVVESLGIQGYELVGWYEQAILKRRVTPDMFQEVINDELSTMIAKWPFVEWKV